VSQFPHILEKPSQLSEQQISFIFSLAKRYRDQGYTGPWQQTADTQKPIVQTLFLEPSTRTKNSFLLAAHKLGLITQDFDAQNSSLVKGESWEDTVKILACHGANLLVVRTSQNHLYHQLQEHFGAKLPLKILNSGNGTSHHPTQALTDYFTMLETFSDLKGKKMALIGDLKHSRVANSLCEILANRGMEIHLCSPSDWKMVNPPNGVSSKFVTTSNADEALKDADLVYLLRVQKERHGDSAFDTNQYHVQYGVTAKRLKLHCPKAKVYHPGPWNVGMELDSELTRLSNFCAFEQVKQSIFIRMALLEAYLS
jgi:aspartate carbamoyltransferase catalytic subunit